MNLKDLFPTPSSEQWLKIIQKELKDIPWNSLTYKNYDGIKVCPIYHYHQDFEQPIQTSFPKYVSFYDFPQSSIGFLELQTNYFSEKSHYQTLFLSLPLNQLKNVNNQQNIYIQVQDFYSENFIDYIPQVPEWASRFEGWILDLSYLQECGANNIDVISFGLFILEKIPRNISIILKIAIANDFYAEIAKLRALNYIIQNFGFQNIKIWAKTAEINKSLLHLENNLIRLTVETVAAVLGGCDFLSIIPFDLNYSEEFSIRISANVLRILEHEAYLNKVTDPLRGSYALEKLTHSYITQIFQQLLFWKSIEPKNLWKTFTDNTLKNLKNILEKYQTKEKLLVGVNIYPFAMETRTEQKKTFPENLIPIRIAQLL